MQFRIGNGFDAHRFAGTDSAGAHVVLGGVEIPHARKLLAHSDGDVLVHALCDALLGALALGDIGRHFPDSDEHYAGISSLSLLEEVLGLVQDKGWYIANMDLTVIAQAPRMAPHIDAMRKRLAQSCASDVERIGIKATTTEGLGFTGRGEGIACQAVVLLQDACP